MANPNLMQYIIDARKAGMQDEVIQHALIQAGWPKKLIQEAFAQMPLEKESSLQEQETDSGSAEIDTTPGSVSNPTTAFATKQPAAGPAQENQAADSENASTARPTDIETELSLQEEIKQLEKTSAPKVDTPQSAQVAPTITKSAPPADLPMANNNPAQDLTKKSKNAQVTPSEKVEKPKSDTIDPLAQYMDDPIEFSPLQKPKSDNQTNKAVEPEKPITSASLRKPMPALDMNPGDLQPETASPNQAKSPHSGADATQTDLPQKNQVLPTAPQNQDQQADAVPANSSAGSQSQSVSGTPSSPSSTSVDSRLKTLNEPVELSQSGISRQTGLDGPTSQTSRVEITPISQPSPAAPQASQMNTIQQNTPAAPTASGSQRSLTIAEIAEAAKKTRQPKEKRHIEMYVLAALAGLVVIASIFAAMP